MYCGHYVDNLQRIDLNAYLPDTAKKVEVKEEVLKIKEPAKKQPSVYVEQVGYRVFPVYNVVDPLCDKFLSLEHNPYLLQSWHQFLEEKPKDFVQIRLYSVEKKLQEAKIERYYRYMLTGKFYDIENKLAPSPTIPGRSASLRAFRKLNLQTRRL